MYNICPVELSRIFLLYDLYVMSKLLDFVDDVVDNLGSHREITYLRALLEDSRATGADHQVAIYQQTGNIDAVNRYLMQQIM